MCRAESVGRRDRRDFAQYAEGFRGWGRDLRRAVAAWYTQPADRLAYQAIKYGSRDGWAQRDLLRLAHPKGVTEQHQAILHRMNERCGMPGRSRPISIQPYPFTHFATLG